MIDPHYTDDAVVLYHGDCLDVLRTLAAGSVDAIVTDPPAGIAFMGAAWDRDKGGRDQWVAWMTGVATAALAACKPGAHALVWALPRTSHWTATAWEDAGWEVRDRVTHLTSQGFPKNHNVSKAIDRAAGVEREVVGVHRGAGMSASVPKAAGVFRDDAWVPKGPDLDETVPATEAAKQWEGFGSALKPSAEDWWLLRKPLGGKTIAACVLAHGTGALNIDATRVGTDGGVRSEGGAVRKQSQPGAIGAYASSPSVPGLGRWPPNVILDDFAAGELDRQSGVSDDSRTREGGFRPDGAAKGVVDFKTHSRATYPVARGDSGGASRFFHTFRYEPKAPASERPRVDGVAHATVKPLELMRWLVRLVCPPGGVVLDPFSGSGTTAEACVMEGFRCITIEREATYLPLIVARLSKPIQRSMFTGEPHPDSIVLQTELDADQHSLSFSAAEPFTPENP